MRVANILARELGAKAIVTGDSLGQVASQTLDNLQVIYQASKLPVFAPLIGMNKEETIEVAKRIGTYEISILPYEDCCTLIVSKHPETRASLEEVLKLEERLNLPEIEALKGAEISSHVPRGV